MESPKTPAYSNNVNQREGESMEVFFRRGVSAIQVMLSETDPEASIMKESKMEDTLWCLIILDYI